MFGGVGVRMRFLHAVVGGLVDGRCGPASAAAAWARLEAAAVRFGRAEIVLVDVTRAPQANRLLLILWP